MLTGTLRPTKRFVSAFVQIENRVLRLLDEARKLKIPVQRGTIQQFARQACRELAHKASTDAERNRYGQFSTSEAWVKKFISRRNLKSLTLHGQAGSVNDEAIADGLERVRSVCAEYDPECIYNVDETGLFFKVLPKRTYLAPGENRKTTRGVKGMTAKDRVTAHMCTNAAGRKVPLSLIGTSKEPRCFRIRKSPVEYFSQKNAWSDVSVFQQWWSKVFLPHVRSVTSKKVVLVMDNHGSHANLVDSREQVTILELPPNCTSKHQPMDAGIIAAWKVRFKTKLLAIRVNSMSSAAQLREQAKQRRVVRGCMGLAEGAEPHILDAAELGVAVWNEVTEETIKRSVQKCFYLCLVFYSSIRLV